LDDIGDDVLAISQNAGRFAHEPLASSGPGPNDESDMIESFLQKSIRGALLRQFTVRAILISLAGNRVDYRINGGADRMTPA
jgi:hypothetical protein